MNDGSEEDDWFTICDEKNIILKKNDDNFYKITFSIDAKDDEDTVLNVLKNGQLFDLLSALNPDVISKCDVVEQNDVHNVFITFKNTKSTQDNSSFRSNSESELDCNIDKFIHVCFALTYTFKQNKCIIESQENMHDDELTVSPFSQGVDKNEFVSVSKIKLKATEKNKKRLVSLCFKITNKKSSNIMNMYIGLYFKKIFHRFKQYFE
jgi:hypothetical protein